MADDPGAKVDQKRRNTTMDVVDVLRRGTVKDPKVAGQLIGDGLAGKDSPAYYAPKQAPLLQTKSGPKFDVADAFSTALGFVDAVTAPKADAVTQPSTVAPTGGAGSSTSPTGTPPVGTLTDLVKESGPLFGPPTPTSGTPVTQPPPNNPGTPGSDSSQATPRQITVLPGANPGVMVADAGNGAASQVLSGTGTSDKQTVVGSESAPFKGTMDSSRPGRVTTEHRSDGSTVITVQPAARYNADGTTTFEYPNVPGTIEDMRLDGGVQQLIIRQRPGQQPIPNLDHHQVTVPSVGDVDNRPHPEGNTTDPGRSGNLRSEVDPAGDRQPLGDPATLVASAGPMDGLFAPGTLTGTGALPPSNTLDRLVADANQVFRPSGTGPRSGTSDTVGVTDPGTTAALDAIIQQSAATTPSTAPPSTTDGEDEPRQNPFKAPIYATSGSIASFFLNRSLNPNLTVGEFLPNGVRGWTQDMIFAGALPSIDVGNAWANALVNGAKSAAATQVLSAGSRQVVNPALNTAANALNTDPRAIAMSGTTDPELQRMLQRSLADNPPAGSVTNNIRADFGLTGRLDELPLLDPRTTTLSPNPGLNVPEPTRLDIGPIVEPRTIYADGTTDPRTPRQQDLGRTSGRIVRPDGGVTAAPEFTRPDTVPPFPVYTVDRPVIDPRITALSPNAALNIPEPTRVDVGPIVEQRPYVNGGNDPSSAGQQGLGRTSGAPSQPSLTFDADPEFVTPRTDGTPTQANYTTADLTNLPPDMRTRSQQITDRTVLGMNLGGALINTGVDEALKAAGQEHNYLLSLGSHALANSLTVGGALSIAERRVIAGAFLHPTWQTIVAQLAADGLLRVLPEPVQEAVIDTCSDDNPVLNAGKFVACNAGYNRNGGTGGQPPLTPPGTGPAGAGLPAADAAPTGALAVGSAVSGPSAPLDRQTVVPGSTRVGADGQSQRYVAGQDLVGDGGDATVAGRVNFFRAEDGTIDAVVRSARRDNGDGTTTVWIPNLGSTVTTNPAGQVTSVQRVAATRVAPGTTMQAVQIRTGDHTQPLAGSGAGSVPGSVTYRAVPDNPRLQDVVVAPTVTQVVNDDGSRTITYSALVPESRALNTDGTTERFRVAVGTPMRQVQHTTVIPPPAASANTAGVASPALTGRPPVAVPGSSYVAPTPEPGRRGEQAPATAGRGLLQQAGGWLQDQAQELGQAWNDSPVTIQRTGDGWQGFAPTGYTVTFPDGRVGDYDTRGARIGGQGPNTLPRWQLESSPPAGILPYLLPSGNGASAPIRGVPAMP